MNARHSGEPASSAATLFEEVMARLQEQLLDAERHMTKPVLERTRMLVGTLLEAHRLGLDALCREVEAQAGRDAWVAIARKEGASRLLTLHGLHPDPLEVRVRQAVHQADLGLGKRARAELSLFEAGRAVVQIAGAEASESVLQVVRDAFDALAPDCALEMETVREPHREKLVPVERLTAGGGGR